MQCPRCRGRLNRATTDHGVFFYCPKCRGRAIGLGLLRHAGSQDAVRTLWIEANKKTGAPGAACPVCDRRMVEVPLTLAPARPPLQLDVCAGCQFVWFDPREYEQFPHAPAGQDVDRPSSPSAREAIAIAEVRMVAERANRQDDDGSPDETWKWLPAMLGMPVETDAPAVRCWPWLTWGLAAALVAIFALTAAHLRNVVDEYGLIPAQLWRYGGLTLLTSFFLHGGIFHLVGNVYFLLIFGDNVEDDLGRWRYALLIAAAALVGAMCHVLGNPREMTPCIGASGGISGVITYYALRFPQARLGFLIRYWLYFRWIRLPAFVALLLWFLLQLLLAYERQLGVGQVAALAHLGGAAVGVVAWLLWRAGRLQAA
jgi:membrane associated rhomboid family serine protease